MSYLSVFMVVFSVLGAIDRIIGNRFGLGEKFEKGFMLLGTMALSMIGMIIIAPFIADVIKPVLNIFENYLHIDPSVIPASLFANDMGGAPLAVSVAADEKMGLFNALVVSSMMGCTISFNIPFALGVVEKDRHNDMFLGFLCGVAAIPAGCFVSGLMLGLPVFALLKDLFIIIVLAAIIILGLLKCPDLCIKAFKVLGIFMKTIITIGLSLGIIRFLTGVSVIDNLDTIENGAAVCLNASIVMTGAFPFLHIVSRLLSKPLKKIGNRININEVSALGFVSTLATNATTFEMVNSMDKKGAILNSAFAISAAFTFAGHLAFTMAFNAAYIFPVIVGKLVAGALSLVVAAFVCKKYNY